MSYRKSSDQINRPMFSARWPARAPRGGNGGTANMTLPPAFLKQKAEGPPSLSPPSIPPGHRVWLTQWQPPTSLCFSPHLVMALRIFHPQCFISCLTALPACLPAPSRPHPVKPPGDARGEGEPAGHSPPQFASSSSLWGSPHSQAHTEQEATPWLPGSPLLTYRVTCGQTPCLPCLQLCLREHDVSSAHTY